jgi:hypothetical protein
MQKKFLLYGFALLAVTVLLMGVISYATESRSTQQQDRPPASTEKVARRVKKKTCGCCAERSARIRAEVRKAHERRMAARREATK